VTDIVVGSSLENEGKLADFATRRLTKSILYNRANSCIVFKKKQKGENEA